MNVPSATVRNVAGRKQDPASSSAGVVCSLRFQGMARRALAALGDCRRGVAAPRGGSRPNEAVRRRGHPGALVVHHLSNAYETLTELSSPTSTPCPI